MPAKLPTATRRDIRNALTPEMLIMVQTIASTGSFAAAARALGLVPSALTYRVRQLEDTLDVLLFDRSARQAMLTEAGRTLLAEAERLLIDLDALANRVQRVATGWEPQLTIALDGALNPLAFFDLCAQFHALHPPAGPPTQLRVREEILSGCWQALEQGRADLVLGAVELPSDTLGSDIQTEALGELPFVFCMAPNHPLAQLPEPISEADLVRHRAIIVADSGPPVGQRMSVGLIRGQATFTVASMHTKMQAIAHGLGCGFLPHWQALPAIARGELLTRAVQQPPRLIRLCMAWRRPNDRAYGHALKWWLEQVQRPITRCALLGTDGIAAHHNEQRPSNAELLAPESPMLSRPQKRPNPS